MEKNFDRWNDEKKRIDAAADYKLYHQRDIWWCSLGVNVGFEQNGTGGDFQRPVLILKGISRETCYIVPLTTSLKRHKFRMPIGLVEEKQAVALMSQIRIVDTKRLVNKVGILDQAVFERLQRAVKDIL